jgi:hypothetical protein
VLGQDKNGADIVVPATKYWLKHPRRRKYQDIGFFPNRDVPSFYNLWRGFAVEPRKGDCSKFLAHIREAALSLAHRHGVRRSQTQEKLFGAAQAFHDLGQKNAQSGLDCPA